MNFDSFQNLSNFCKSDHHRKHRRCHGKLLSIYLQYDFTNYQPQYCIEARGLNVGLSAFEARPS